MKKLVLFLIFLNWLVSAKAQTQWQMVDTALSTLDGSNTFITINKNNIPYVVYSDAALSSKATVKRFNGIHWETVGIPGFSAAQADCITMAFDGKGTPYVAYMDGSPNWYRRATVMKFDGSNWVTVGIMGFTPGAASYTSIAIDTNGTPYVAFRDQGANVYNSWPNGFRASVMKFDGSNWVYVGAPGFSAGSGPYGASYTTIIFDKNNIPYVAYSDDSNSDLATVQKFDGTNWVYVGAHGFANWNATYTKSMAFDKSNSPYIVCSVANKATVMKFDGNNWISVGSAGFSQGGTDGAGIIIDNNDMIYVAYKDYANGQKATVMKFDGTNWITVGLAGFSATVVDFTTLAIDGLGNLYVAYEDGTPYYGGWQYPHYRAVVMKFGNNAAGIKENKNNFSFTIYPNPTGNTFNICYQGNCSDVTVNIKNELGQYIITKKYISQKEIQETFNLSSQSKGVYFVELISGDAREVKKIILE